MGKIKIYEVIGNNKENLSFRTAMMRKYSEKSSFFNGNTEGYNFGDVEVFVDKEDSQICVRMFGEEHKINKIKSRLENAIKNFELVKVA